MLERGVRGKIDSRERVREKASISAGGADWGVECGGKGCAGEGELLLERRVKLRVRNEAGVSELLECL